MAIHKHHGMWYAGWIVVCAQCGKRGHARHGEARQSVAFHSLLEQDWYADWHDGVMEIMANAFWLCPECKEKEKR